MTMTDEHRNDHPLGVTLSAASPARAVVSQMLDAGVVLILGHV